MSQEDVNYDWEMRDEKMPFQYHMVAGCLAGVIEHVLMLPFDSIKTHQQVAKNMNITDAIKMIYHQGKGGLQNFYLGLKIIAAGCMPAHAIFFSTYEFAKLKFGIDDEELHPYLFSLTGACATFFHDLIMTPIDVVKQRQQISSQSPSEIFRQMKQNEGLFSLFRSFKITYLMNVPQQALLMAMNESLKVLSFKQDQHNFASYFTCAGIAGGIASFITTPLDVVKTKLQTQKFEISSKNQKNTSFNAVNLNKAPQFYNSTISDNRSQYVKYESIKQTCQIIFQEDGVKGFYRGAPTRMMMVAPSAAVSWASYEQIKKMLQQRFNDQKSLF